MPITEHTTTVIETSAAQAVENLIVDGVHFREMLNTLALCGVGIEKFGNKWAVVSGQGDDAGYFRYCDSLHDAVKLAVDRLQGNVNFCDKE